MRKNWLAAAWTRRFRARPVVPDAAFQGSAEPYPGHWRRFPGPWPAAQADQAGAEARVSGQQAALEAALARLPELWRRVVTARDVAHRDDQQVAGELDLTVGQERDILARARAALRERLDRTGTDAPR
jgi:RNA polymerase sigma-70 factor (ECF subfamily)